jgi:hypothetical protein
VGVARDHDSERQQRENNQDGHDALDGEYPFHVMVMRGGRW